MAIAEISLNKPDFTSLKVVYSECNVTSKMFYT
jgi:hypothetical protein